MVRTLLSVVLFLLPFTAHAGEDIGIWKVTRYYTPVEGQERYYNGWKAHAGVCKVSNLYYAPYGGARKGDYTAEACMQGSGDLYVTADGTDLRTEQPYAVAACPRSFLGQILHVAEIGYVRCADTGGSVKGKTLDIWAGIGEEGYDNIQKGIGGPLLVHRKQ